MTIKEFIEVTKAEQGINDAELARRLGVSQTMIIYYKRGSIPSLELARKIFKDFGVVVLPYSKEGLTYEA